MLSNAAQGLINEANEKLLYAPDHKVTTIEGACELFWGHGFHDECAGSVGELYHVARIGQFLMFTDSQGFVSVEEEETEDEARGLFHAHETKLDNLKGE